MFHDKQKQTCGPLYQKQLDYYAKGDPFLMRAFAAGFVTGEAEKIYLGACAAAMFRPSKQHLDTLFRIALKASETYELSIRVLNCPDETEIWLFTTRALAMSSARWKKQDAILRPGTLLGVY